MAYDYFSSVKILLEQGDKKDWEGKDIAWYFGQLVKNVNEFGVQQFKIKNDKEAKAIIEEIGAFAFMVANLSDQAKEAKDASKKKVKRKTKAKPKPIDVPPKK